MLTGVNELLDAVCELGSFASVSESLLAGVVPVGTSKFGVGSPNRLTVGGAVICFRSKMKVKLRAISREKEGERDREKTRQK